MLEGKAEAVSLECSVIYSRSGNSGSIREFEARRSRVSHLKTLSKIIFTSRTEEWKGGGSTPHPGRDFHISTLIALDTSSLPASSAVATLECQKNVLTRHRR